MGMAVVNVGLVGHIDKMTTKRFRIFQRIAQAQGATTTSTTTSTAPTTIPGSPNEVSVTTYFPSFAEAWGSSFKAPTDDLLNTLNWTIFILSIGELSLDQLRQQHFNVDASKYPDPFLMGVVGFAGQVYRLLLNNGKPFVQKVSDKRTPLETLRTSITTNSKIPDNLSNSFPQSFLQTKIGNFKSKVISILTQLDALSVTR